ncbi:unnamed protein product [Lathyrus sativus]|nr:unnamed protein product [Lathyrus sativus]
MARMLI